MPHVSLEEIDLLLLSIFASFGRKRDEVTGEWRK
jgi:hypothetical protein